MSTVAGGADATIYVIFIVAGLPAHVEVMLVEVRNAPPPLPEELPPVEPEPDGGIGISSPGGGGGCSPEEIVIGVEHENPLPEAESVPVPAVLPEL